MKKIQSLLILISLLFNSGCLTSILWQGSEHYSDNIKKFLISKNDNKIVFIGKKFHYILDDNSKIIQKLLNWNGKNKLQVTITNFHVSQTNSVKTDMVISATLKDMSKSDEIFLKDLGFTESEFQGDKILSKKITLKGKRYLPKPGVDYDSIAAPLSKGYDITVKYNSLSKNIEKVALTPIGVTMDGVAIIVESSIIGPFQNFV